MKKFLLYFPGELLESCLVVSLILGSLWLYSLVFPLYGYIHAGILAAFWVAAWKTVWSLDANNGIDWSEREDEEEYDID